MITEDAIEYLKSNSEKYTIKEIAAIIGRSYNHTVILLSNNDLKYKPTIKVRQPGKVNSAIEWCLQNPQLSKKDMAEHLGISTRLLYSWVEKTGTDPKRIGHLYYTDLQRKRQLQNKFIHDNMGKISIREIAKTLKVSTDTIRLRIRDNFELNDKRFSSVDFKTVLTRLKNYDKVVERDRGIGKLKFKKKITNDNFEKYGEKLFDEDNMYIDDKKTSYKDEKIYLKGNEPCLENCF